VVSNPQERSDVAATSTGNSDAGGSPLAGGGGDGPSGGATAGADPVAVPSIEPVLPTVELPAVSARAVDGDADPVGAILSGTPADIAAVQAGPAPWDTPFATLPLDDSPAALFGAQPPVAAPAPSEPTALDSIAATASDPQVLAAAGVAFLIGAHVSASRLLCPDEVRLMFTNVRLVPCMVRETIAGHLVPLTSALPATGPAGPVAALSPAVAPEGAVAEEVATNRGDKVGGFKGLAEAFRNGFEDALGGPRPDIGESLGDSRLMIQLGMALGFVYAAFLSVWFWATRLRRPRARDREAA
jgi:hypothetical protein